jgi:hypothetical protein
MPRFYCHLSAPDGFFPDRIGWEVDDLATAHKRAVKLAERVMRLSDLADHRSDWRKWKVQIVEDNSRRVMTVMFPSRHANDDTSTGWELKGARALLRYLDVSWNEVGNRRPRRRGRAL